MWSEECDAHFLNYNGKYGDKWDSIHIPRLQVIAAGHNVISVPVDYPHPIDQTQEETGNLLQSYKRFGQIDNLVLSIWREAYELGLTTQVPPS